jgi:uncharacterized protein YejL (UPF0352 family)
MITVLVIATVATNLLNSKFASNQAQPKIITNPLVRVAINSDIIDTNKAS